MEVQLVMMSIICVFITVLLWSIKNLLTKLIRFFDERMKAIETEVFKNIPLQIHELRKELHNRLDVLESKFDKIVHLLLDNNKDKK